MLRYLQSMIICTSICFTCFLHSNAQVDHSINSQSPIKSLNFSIWTEYSGISFKDLSQEEKTSKFQHVFENLLQFSKTHHIRRVLIKILNPQEFEFFHPTCFDDTRDDNFYYWANLLNEYVQIEALFTPEAFQLEPLSLTDQARDYFGRYFELMPPFQNLKQKLEWASFINSIPYDMPNRVIKGITINPESLKEDDIQHVINTIDMWKHNSDQSQFAENPYRRITIGCSLKLDQKSLALCNLARFPLQTDLHGQRPDDIGIDRPKYFPEGNAPSWRSSWDLYIHEALLNHVYLRMDDKRLIAPIYQNEHYLKYPNINNCEGVEQLAQIMTKTLKGKPCIQGPGLISCEQKSTNIHGTYTFFKTGSLAEETGRLSTGSLIEIQPPYVDRAVQKVVARLPNNNKSLKLTSPICITHSLQNIPYYIAPIPAKWDSPRLSNFLRAHIYYVFNTDYDPVEGYFLGNWSLDNALHLLFNPDASANSFLTEPIFTDFNGQPQPPTNNLVLHEFTTIPNGEFISEYNWGLGNTLHE